MREFEAYLQTTDFSPFRDALRTLWDDLRGEAKLETLEGQVTLEVIGDGRGHMTVRGELRDIAGYLGGTLRQLDELIEQCPVLGLSRDRADSPRVQNTKCRPFCRRV